MSKKEEHLTSRDFLNKDSMKPLISNSKALEYLQVKITGESEKEMSGDTAMFAKFNKFLDK
jgi:hypothetical protein